ncbi:Sphingosine N-acyltransferase lag1 [Coemansia thaxteri]|nr:Sphingosine N-acyltransferase lag1 [Coemansia thaxteri]KAJ2476474.1 Sphingosine N-acyltransferase lag1 [Coemansia sp. RSA 2320]
MPPLEVMSQPNIAALTEHESTRLHRSTTTTPSDESTDISATDTYVHTKRESLARRLRHRRPAKPVPEVRTLETGRVADNSRAARRLSPKRNVILNTRNPVIIWLAKNELQLSLALLAMVHSCYWAGYEWPSLWIRMQHKSTLADNRTVEGGDRYVRGIHDVKFVFYWITQIIAARAILLHHILPAMTRIFGITNERKQRRFCEMGWSMLYITASWCIGFRVWQTSPYYMSTQNLYANYPDDHVIMSYGLKWFYLVQSAFWLSNIYTIHIEERRKDHTEMLAHHAVTITLVLFSYAFHFTRFGHVFMLVMDFPDIFLSSAKMFRYLDHEIIPNVLFGIFSVSWIITKHCLCLKMMVSIWTQGTSLVPLEKRYPQYPNSYASYPIVGALWFVLCVLQVILLYWFWLILKVLQKVLIKGEHADDNRSDEEEAEGGETGDEEDKEDSTVVEDGDSGVDISSNCSAE